jgi:heptosyltransferase-3
MLRALVYRPGSLGDTLVSLPAVARIRAQYPAHRLTLLTESEDAGSGRVSPWTILKETGWFDDVYFYVVKPSSIRERWHNLALAARLRDVGYHDIFSLAPPRTTRQLRVDAGIFRGVLGAQRYHAASRAAWPPQADEHEGLRLLRIVDPAATGDALGDFRLAIPAAARAQGLEILNDIGQRPGQVLVGLGPGSGRPSTKWPAERFAAVGDALLRQFKDVLLLAIGGSSERALCDQLCAAWGPRSHNLAGRLGVFGSASILSQCVTFIGNDSGPTHLAAMVGTPCVAIFSARNAPGHWQPLGRHHVVLEERPECAGCMLDECVLEAKKCLTRIQIGRVVREAVSMIESRASACVAT